MFTTHRTELMWGGRKMTIETGKIARQANGAVMVTYGDTVVLATAVAEKNARPGVDFFPLTINYQEKTFAAGKIPGGFFKREGRPSEKETLTSRLIDRPLRPLFAKNFKFAGILPIVIAMEQLDFLHIVLTHALYAIFSRAFGTFVFWALNSWPSLMREQQRRTSFSWTWHWPGNMIEAKRPIPSISLLSDDLSNCSPQEMLALAVDRSDAEAFCETSCRNRKPWPISVLSQNVDCALSRTMKLFRSVPFVARHDPFPPTSLADKAAFKYCCWPKEKMVIFNLIPPLGEATEKMFPPSFSITPPRGVSKEDATFFGLQLKEMDGRPPAAFPFFPTTFSVSFVFTFVTGSVTVQATLMPTNPMWSLTTFTDSSDLASTPGPRNRTYCPWPSSSNGLAGALAPFLAIGTSSENVCNEQTPIFGLNWQDLPV